MMQPASDAINSAAADAAGTVDFFSPDNLLNLVNEYALPFGVKLITAILVFWIGRMVARSLRKLLIRATNGRLDPSLQKFLSSTAYALMLAVVCMAALKRLGVETTAAVAILGAAGLAVGLAFQGTLSNFASGVLLIVFKPFKVGDLVDVGGTVGVVEEISVFTTTLITPDNKTVIIPNGTVAGGAITNISAKGNLRVDTEVGVSYSDDLKKTKQIIEQTLASDDRVLKEPAPTVAVSNLGASSVDFVVRPWCKVEDYWDVRFDTIQRVKEALDEAGISIPFPQQDLYVKEVSKDISKAA